MKLKFSQTLGWCWFLLGVAAGQAADWPQRSGPFGDYSTPEVIAAWQGAPAKLWHLPLGEGYSAPTVAKGKLYLHAK
jgi:hypothetical protein